MTREGRRSPEERLRHFVAVVEHCIGRRAIQEGTLKATFKLETAQGKSMELTTDFGDEEDVRSLLLDFRKLIAPKDDAHFTSICNIIEMLDNPCVDDDLLEYNRTNRASWKQALAGQLRFVYNGRTLGGEDFLGTLINGLWFHSDRAEETFYRSLDPVSQALLRQEAYAAIYHCLRVANAQRNVINDLFARRGGMA
jgi:hypothetical protein